MGQKAYEAEDIVIRFDPRRCIHAAECVHGLPAVFDPDRRPWITADAASASEIVDVVQQCPSGALTHERLDGGPAEVVAPDPSVTTVRNGPLHLRGRCTVTDHDGTQIDIGPRATLCRCGASSNKPFCDNSHIEAGFRDDR